MAATTEGSASAIELGAQIMHVSRDRKLPKLRGQPRDDEDGDIIDWLEDIKSYLNASRMSENERFDYVMEHLVWRSEIVDETVI